MAGSSSQLVIIQATPFCNINCDYCYLPDRSNPAQISVETIRRISRFIFDKHSPLRGKATMLWHAGEPLVVSRASYRSFFETIDQENITTTDIEHAFQTNGTLISQEWCDFIKEWDIKIGVSLDGPQFLHDAHRKTRGNKGTFADVMNGISLLRKNSIPFHTISVLSRESLKYAREFWDFIVAEDLTRVAFNIDEAEGVNLESSMTPSGDCVSEYRSFFTELLTLRASSGRKMFIRELDFMLDVILNARENLKGAENLPGEILNFAYDGSVSTFSPELLSMRDIYWDNFIFAHTQHNSYLDLLRNPHFLRVNTEIQNGVEACRSECEYFGICGGGAPSNKLYENRSFASTETITCRLRIKTLAEICMGHLESLSAQDYPQFGGNPPSS